MQSAHDLTLKVRVRKDHAARTHVAQVDLSPIRGADDALIELRAGHARIVERVVDERSSADVSKRAPFNVLLTIELTCT